jgi:hypothetical protein
MAAGTGDATALLITGVGLAGEAGLLGCSPTLGPGAARHVNRSALGAKCHRRLPRTH